MPALYLCRLEVGQFGGLDLVGQVVVQPLAGILGRCLAVVDLEVIHIIINGITDPIMVILDASGMGEPLHGLFDRLVIGEQAIAAQRLVDAPAVPGEAGNPGAAALGAPEADMPAR